jgi:tRNA threonylcarbamoyladenosine biosynthesis protein TsaE
MRQNSVMPQAVPQRVTLANPAATHSLARTVAGMVAAGDAILLEGELGAGKSEFAREFLRELAGDPVLEVPSPTFTLVQSYETRLGPVHHFDLWRLENESDLIELGWDEARADIVVVEWPDRLGALRPSDALTISLALADGEAREAALSGWDDRFAQWPLPITASPPGHPTSGTAGPGVADRQDAPNATATGMAARDMTATGTTVRATTTPAGPSGSRSNQPSGPARR